MTMQIKGATRQQVLSEAERRGGLVTARVRERYADVFIPFQIVDLGDGTVAAVLVPGEPFELFTRKKDDVQPFFGSLLEKVTLFDTNLYQPKQLPAECDMSVEAVCMDASQTYVSYAEEAFSEDMGPVVIAALGGTLYNGNAVTTIDTTDGWIPEGLKYNPERGFAPLFQAIRESAVLEYTSGDGASVNVVLCPLADIPSGNARPLNTSNGNPNPPNWYNCPEGIRWGRLGRADGALMFSVRILKPMAVIFEPVPDGEGVLVPSAVGLRLRLRARGFEIASGAGNANS